MKKDPFKIFDNTDLDGVEIAVDPNDAEEFGAFEDEMPLDDVIDAAYDKEV